MKTELYVKVAKKLGRILSYKALIFSIVILGTLFSYSTAKADTTWLNVASTTMGTVGLPATTYVGFPITFTNPLVGIKYAGDYKTGSCTVAVYLFTFDITASSSLDILGSRHASFGTGVSDGAGGCRFTIGTVRTGGNYPLGTLVGTTTGMYLPAGNYWALLTATAGQNFAGVNGGAESAKMYKYTVTSGWTGYYEINYPSLYLISTATSTIPAPSMNPDTTTRLVDFTPHEGAVLPSATPVTFSLTAYVNPADIGTFIGVRFTFHNIDQNVLLLNELSPSDFYILDGFEATTSGNFYYTSAPYILGDGNYRAEAQIERSYLGGWVVNPFSPINDSQSHQFIVGSSTYLGNLSQTMFSDTEDFFAGASATSSLVTAGSCNPLSWDTLNCLSYLFIPSGAEMTNTILGLKDMVLTRVPWGYGTRVFTILSGTATTALPSFTVNLHLGAGSLTPATSSLAFDPDDMLGGGMALAGSIKDVTYGKTAREILDPLVKLGVALTVLFLIVNDLLRMPHGSSGGSPNRSNRANETA